MTLFLQVASLVGLIALFAAWGNWVWEANRPITSPQSLGEVIVHGVAQDAVNTTAQTLALGVAGTIAEHYRTVDFINTAATTADEFLIRASGSAPEPLLLQSKSSEERLDVSVEFAGAKLDSKGLAALFSRPQRKRGALALAVTLVPTGDDKTWRATASANFAENSAYGFRTEAIGVLDEVAEKIGLRFVQAHYAVGDPFFAALSEDDFRKLWQVRREAAELALRGASGDPVANDPLSNEATAEYNKVAHLLTRYRRREELQRLGGYLAQASGKLSIARSHFQAAQTYAQEPEDKDALSSLLAALDLEIDNRQDRATGITPETTGQPDGKLDELLTELAKRNAALIETLNLSALQERGSTTRPPRIGLVTGQPSNDWSERVRVIRQPTASTQNGLQEHADTVLSFVFSLAPKAAVVVSPVVGTQSQVGLRDEIFRALSDLATEELDVLYVDFGVSAKSFGKENGGERWAAFTNEQLDLLSGFEGLVVLPAGNDSVEVPGLDRSGDTPAFAIVGATATATRAMPYSNLGPGVDFVAPGDVTVLYQGTTLVQQRGTSFSAAAFAAGSALLAATQESGTHGSNLKAALAQTSVSIEQGDLPDFKAAVARLRRIAGN